MKSGNIKNLDKVQAYLKQVPHGTKREAVIGIAEYLVGDSRHGFKHDDPYMQTTREKVYGQTFFSERQRKKVMAMIRSGEIVIGSRKYSPTQSSEGYGFKPTNNGYGAVITNDSPGAYWTRIWRGWKNWKSSAQVIQSNIKGALRHATARINSILKKK